MATRSRKGYWRMSRNSDVQRALTNRWLHARGVPDMRATWIVLHYGPVLSAKAVRNRPVRTRMPRGGGAGAGLPGQFPATRLGRFIDEPDPSILCFVFFDASTFLQRANAPHDSPFELQPGISTS